MTNVCTSITTALVEVQNIARYRNSFVLKKENCKLLAAGPSYFGTGPVATGVPRVCVQHLCSYLSAPMRNLRDLRCQCGWPGKREEDGEVWKVEGGGVSRVREALWQL